MKVTCKGNILIAAIRAIAPIVPKTHTLEEFQCINFNLRDQIITLQAKNGRGTAMVECPTVSTEGECANILLKKSSFMALVEQADDTVEITRDSSTSITFRTGNATYRLPTLAASVENALIKDAGHSIIESATEHSEMTQADLRKLLTATELSRSKEEHRGIMTCIQLKKTDDTLRAASTDGRRLHWSSIPAINTTDQFSIALGTDIVPILKTALKADSLEPVHIYAESKHMLISTCIRYVTDEKATDESDTDKRQYRMTIQMPLDAGVFPDIRRVIRPTEVFCKVSKDSLTRCVKRVKLVSDDVTIRMTTDLVISGKGPSANNEAEAENVITETENAVPRDAVTISVHYLLDALKSFDAETVHLEAEPDAKDAGFAPISITNPDIGFNSIIMPLKKI